METPAAVVEHGTPAADDVIRLPPVGRGWRVLLLLTLTGMFLAGTTIGQDDWWPFSPWRMFSTSTSPSGSVNSVRIEVRRGDDPTWQIAPIVLSSVGLNRAEVEGRMPEITADPTILGTLARSHSRLRPGEPPWRGVRVVHNEVLLSNGAPTGAERDTVVAEWVAP